MQDECNYMGSSYMSEDIPKEHGYIPEDFGYMPLEWGHMQEQHTFVAGIFLRIQLFFLFVLD